MKPIACLAALGLVFAAAPASAEVVAASAAGLTSRSLIAVKASPEETWAALVQPALPWRRA